MTFFSLPMFGLPFALLSFFCWMGVAENLHLRTLKYTASLLGLSYLGLFLSLLFGSFQSVEWFHAILPLVSSVAAWSFFITLTRSSP